MKLTNKEVKKYMMWRTDEEFIHCPDAIAAACNDVYEEYKNNDFHNWHNHPRVQFTNVYYIELPDGMKTELWGEEDIDVKEGDILTFPSYIFHQSKVNNTNKRKTVVSFNTSFDHINIDKINKT